MSTSHTPPAAVRKAAVLGLKLRREHGRGGTEVGVARARDLKNGRALSLETVKRMKAFFDRHQVDKKAQGFRPGEPGYPSPGRVAWLLWGGDAGWKWARAVVRQEGRSGGRRGGAPRKNPVKIGSHQDLFYRTQTGVPKQTGIYLDEEGLTPEEMREIVRRGGLDPDDYNKLIEQADILDPDGDLSSELEALDHERLDSIADRIVEMLRPAVYDAVNQEPYIENEFDEFLATLNSDATADDPGYEPPRNILKWLRETHNVDTAAVPPEVWNDPGLYSTSLDDTSGRDYGCVATRYAMRDSELPLDSTAFNEMDLTDDDVTALEEAQALPAAEDRARISEKIREALPDLTWSRRIDNTTRRNDIRDLGKPKTTGDVRVAEVPVYIMLDAEELKQRIEQYHESTAVKNEPVVVYRFAGTNQTPAGASGRGLYVVQLTETGHLREESKALGHCIGNEQHGHPQKLRSGEVRVYSLRTEAGKPKFTIEVSNRGAPPDQGEEGFRHYEAKDIRQIKGKANRLPGFERGKEAMTKGDEVRAVVEFLTQYLGVPADALTDVIDVRGGVRSMRDAGIDPAVPPPVRRKNPAGVHAVERVPTSPKGARLALKDYDRPLGGVWGM